MYPHERSLVEQLSDKPFALIGVNSDGDDLEAILKVKEEKNLTWRSFQNESSTGTISQQWAIEGWPTIYIIDAKGVIRFKGHGGDFDSVIEECLAEIGHDVKIELNDPGEKKDLEHEDDEEAADQKKDDEQTADSEESSATEDREKTETDDGN